MRFATSPADFAVQKRFGRNLNGRAVISVDLPLTDEETLIGSRREYDNR